MSTITNAVKPSIPGSGVSAVQTQGASLSQSPAVRAAVDAIVSEVRAKSAPITGVRGPLSAELKASADEFMKRAGSIRGRDLLFPFIGSGAGNGPFVELIDGSVKIDLITAIGVNFFGHSHPELVRAAAEASVGNVVMQGHLLMNEQPCRLSETILAEARKRSNMAHVFLCNSGVMANENALKVCYQKHAPASRVLAFKDCFMGRTITMSQIGDSAANRVGIPLSTLIDYMPFYDPAAAKRMGAGDVSGQTRYIDMCVSHLRQYVERYPGQHACFIFELIQGEGGFNTAPPEFFRELMTVCKSAGIAVWDDEVQTFGRTTSMFAFDALNLGDLVDIVCIGKMTQVCAVLYKAEYNPKPGLLSQTFLASNDALAAGQRVIEMLRDSDLYGPNGRIAKHHKAFTEQVRALAAKHPQCFPRTNPHVDDIVGGTGGMMRFTPFAGKKEPVMKLVKLMFEEGVIGFYAGHDPYHIRLLPPIPAMDESLWPAVFQIIERAMARVA